MNNWLKSFSPSQVEGLLALSSPLFNRFLVGYAFSSTSSWMQRVCFAFLAWEMTQSTFWLGIISFAEFLPILLFSPFVGDAIDRLNKKKIILLFEILPALIMLLLLVLLISGNLNLTLLIAIAFIVGTSMAISHPAQLAWYPTLLKKAEHIGSGANIYILSLNLSRFLGAALVGAVIAFSGIEMAVGLTAIGYLIFVFFLLSIADKDVLPKKDKRNSAIRGALDGWRYLQERKVLGGVLIAIALTSAGARGLPELAPAISELKLDQSAEVFSLLISFTGLGSVLAGIWNFTARDNSVETAIRQTISFSFVLAICVALLAFVQSLIWALALFALLGFAITVTAVRSQQVIQTLVSDDMRGRVNSLYFLTFRGGTAFGALWMGIASSVIGLTLTTILGAIICIIAWKVGKYLVHTSDGLGQERVQSQ